MGLNFIIFMQMDASLLIAGALLLGVPMAVLVPPFCFPSRIGGMVNLSRVLLRYILVGVLGAVLPFLFVVSGVSMIPVIYWHTPFSNLVIYICLMCVNTGLSAIVYRIFNHQKTLRKELP